MSQCFLSQTLLSPPAGATGAPALPPEWVCGLPYPACGPHSHLPSEASPGKERAVSAVPLPCPSYLRDAAGPAQAFPGRTVPQPAQADPSLGGAGPTPNCTLGAKDRTLPHVPSLLDADVEGQSRDCTVPLCRMKSRSSRPSIYELEKEFLS